VLLAAVLVVIAVPRLAADPAFALDLDAPSGVEGEAGATVRYDVTASLASDGIATEDGVLGWSVSLSCENGAIVTATTDGTVVDELFDEGFRFTELTAGPDNEGAVSAVVFSFREPVTLRPAGAAEILRLTVEASVPEPVGDACEPAVTRVFYVDGRQGSGDPVGNRVVYRGASYTAELGSVSTDVCPLPTGGLQMPGDCNQDGSLDISDAICLFGYLFLGAPTELPCGDGANTDVANILLLDHNGDSDLDIADGIGVVVYLFQGGAPPIAGMECLPIERCPDECVP